MTEPAAEILRWFDPAPDALLDLLRARVDDVILRTIAEADYGYQVPQNLAALRAIQDTGKVPRPLEWEPREVLQLTHWEEPGPNDRHAHLRRAFACAILLRAGGDAESQPHLRGENSTVAVLVDSAQVLGPDVQRAAASAIAWGFHHAPSGDGERPFFALALLLLAVFIGPAVYPGQRVIRLVEWVIAEEAEERSCQGEALGPDDSAWLRGLTCFDQRHLLWCSLACRMEEAAPRYSGRRVQQRVSEIPRRLMLLL
ncbi:MAG: hypothetical protein K0Q72_5086 [Armatimonadetes bacterium]|jgi:hypothetical protein|nr:hypothetical protein [Armatimonadota bacterium]